MAETNPKRVKLSGHASSSSSVDELEGKTLCMVFRSGYGWTAGSLDIRGIKARDLLLGRRKYKPCFRKLLERKRKDDSTSHLARHNAVKLNSKIYIVGGEDLAAVGADPANFDASLSRVTSVDIISWKLESECPMTSGKSNPALTDIGGYIYALAGPPIYFAQPPCFELYEPLAKSWVGDDDVVSDPPFTDSSTREAFIAYVLLPDGILHISTSTIGYCFDPHRNRWGKTKSFDEEGYYRDRKDDKIRGKPFEFAGEALSFSFVGSNNNDDWVVLIATSHIRRLLLVAFLVKNGKVVARQFFRGALQIEMNDDDKIGRRYGDIVGDPRCAALGRTTSSGNVALFSGVCSSYPPPHPRLRYSDYDSDSDYDCGAAAQAYQTYTYIHLATYSIKLLKDQQRNFLEIERLSHFRYSLDGYDGNYGRGPWCMQPIGCFFIDDDDGGGSDATKGLSPSPTFSFFGVVH